MKPGNRQPPPGGAKVPSPAESRLILRDERSAKPLTTSFSVERGLLLSLGGPEERTLESHDSKGGGTVVRDGSFLFTSESVTEGHPDKMADQISDAVLDAIYEQDPYGRVACETLVTTGLVLVAGEITTECYIDIPKIARETVHDIGYTKARYGFDYHTCAVMTSIDEQSGDIAMGVDKALEAKRGDMAAVDDSAVGAGDQGMMFGYACTQTPELMPLPIVLAHKLSLRLADVRKQRLVNYLRPDGKSQVTVEYRNGRPERVTTVVLAAQHSEEVTLAQMQDDLIKLVIEPVVPPDLVGRDTTYLINPTGRFVVGGPQGDTGLTGRKIIVDTYGGWARHGGGAFSGKDPTKVDRSASYAARYAAKNLVASGVAEECEVQLAYAIGVAQPVSIMVDTFGTGRLPDDKIAAIVRQIFDLTPGGIIRTLSLRRPLYRQVGAYGHFGRADLDLPWERTDKVDDIQAAAGLGSCGTAAAASAKP